MARTVESFEKGRKSSTVSDLGVYLRSSQKHINPTNPKVEVLIREELRVAAKLIQHCSGLHLLTGDTPIDAREQDISDPDVYCPVSIGPGADLALEGVEEGDVISTYEGRTLRMSPTTIANSLINGGELLEPVTNNSEEYVLEIDSGR